jgi:hypothetical protein
LGLEDWPVPVILDRYPALDVGPTPLNLPRVSLVKNWTVGEVVKAVGMAPGACLRENEGRDDD